MAHTLLPRLAGRVAVITGSTQGIGFAIARRLAREGASLVVSSRKEAHVKKAVAELGCEGVPVHGTVCHVGNPEHRDQLVTRALETFGKIDILVNNAATNPHFGALMDVTEDQWDKIMDVNVRAHFFLSRRVAQSMSQRKTGAILFLSSIAGLKPMQNMGPYSISKTSVLGVTQTMASEWAASGIRVNAICPGLIRTRFSEPLWKNSDAFEKKIPLGRLGEPDDIASAAAFLCSDDASYITGEALVVSGGLGRLD